MFGSTKSALKFSPQKNRDPRRKWHPWLEERIRKTQKKVCTTLPKKQKIDWCAHCALRKKDFWRCFSTRNSAEFPTGSDFPHLVSKIHLSTQKCREKNSLLAGLVCCTYDHKSFVRFFSPSSVNYFIYAFEERKKQPTICSLDSRKSFLNKDCSLRHFVRGFAVFLFYRPLCVW